MKIIVFVLILLWSKSTLAQQKLTSDIEKSTEKALAFLSGEDSDMEYSAYAVYHYLERLYQLPPINNDTFYIKKMVAYKIKRLFIYKKVQTKTQKYLLTQIV